MAEALAHPQRVRGPDQAVLIFAVDDVDAWYARLSEHGITFVTPPTGATGASGSRLSVTPEGNLVEINKDL